LFRPLFNSEQTPHADASTILEGDTPVTTLLVILLLLWVLGLATANTLGGLIHVLLIIAIVIFFLRMLQGRNPLRG
jgi:4-hydroxybenzoate polyprenyltransferase